MVATEPLQSFHATQACLEAYRGQESRGEVALHSIGYASSPVGLSLGREPRQGVEVWFCRIEAAYLLGGCRKGWRAASEATSSLLHSASTQKVF